MADQQPVMIGADPYTMQLQDIQQRKAMAQALQQQALTPQAQTVLHSTMGGDLVVRNGIAPALAKVGEAFFAGQMGKQQNAQALDVQKQQQAATGQWMQNVNALQQPDPLQAITTNAQAIGNTPEATATNAQGATQNAQANSDNQQAAVDRRGQLLSTLAQGQGISPMAGALGGGLAQQMMTPKPADFTTVDMGDKIVFMNKTTGQMVGQPLPKGVSPDKAAEIQAGWQKLASEQNFTGGQNALNRGTELKKADMEITASRNNMITGKDQFYTDPNSGKQFVQNPVLGTNIDVSNGMHIDPQTGKAYNVTPTADGKMNLTPNPKYDQPVNANAPGAPAVATSDPAAKAVTAAVSQQAHIDYLRGQVAAARQTALQGGTNTFGWGNGGSDAGQRLNTSYNAMQGAIMSQDKSDATLGRLTNYDGQKFLEALPQASQFGMTQSKYTKGLDAYDALLTSQEKALHDKFPTYGLGTDKQVKIGAAPASAAAPAQGTRPPLSSFGPGT